MTDIFSHPVSLAGRRYAGALFDAASDAACVDGVAKNMESLAALLRDSADLRRFIASPLYNAAAQKQFVAAFVKQAGGSLAKTGKGEKPGADAVFSRFLEVLAQHRRLYILPQIIEVFAALAAKARGELRVSVLSAEALSAEKQAALLALLAEIAAKDKQYGKYLRAEKLLLQIQVDPALLGGFIMRCGSLLIDASLRSKLTSLKLALKEVG